MKEQVPISEAARADSPEFDDLRDDGTREVLPDVAYKRLAIVNVAFIGKAGSGDRQWVLIDAGVRGTTGMIRRAARERFGDASRPAAIVMTHGHFDHVSALEKLAEEWDAPVYAHPLELPYLNGQAAYPPADPSVGGGMMATLSRFYPRGPVNVGNRLQALADNGKVPGMPDWRWIHTPGHTPGHVALWRAADRTLITGDAVISTRQESAYAVTVQKEELHGPPMYYTQDWNEARDSVVRLAALEPELIITGHGAALRGAAMRESLRRLVTNFDQIAVPRDGRYVENPAGIGSGREYANAKH